MDSSHLRADRQRILRTSSYAESECNWEYLLELLSFLFSSNFSISTSSLSSLVSRAVLKRNQAHQAKKTLDVSDMVTVQ